ncbi:MAG: amino acid permease [Gammaproteobacteria bacterium]
MTPPRTAAVKRKMGVFTLTALVAGNMIGSGIFLLPASLAQYGSISIASWVFTAVGAVLLGLVFANLSRIKPMVGGPYAYCREAFGDLIAFLIAYNYWIALWVGNAAIVVAFTGYMSVFFPQLHDHYIACYTSISVVWLLTVVNIIGVRQAGILQLCATILKLLPLIAIGLFGVFHMTPANFSAFNVSGQSHLSAFTGAAALTLWTFIGVESATIPAAEVERPTITIPRATIWGVLIAAVVYILSSVAIMGVVPNKQLAQSSAPFADAALTLFGPWGALLVAAGAAISCFGALNGWILLQGRVPFAAALDGLFPKIFARQTASETPYVGLIVSALLISGLLLLTISKQLIDQFTFIILLAVLATLIPYLLTTCAAIIIYIKQHRLTAKPLSLTAVVIALAAFCYSFWAIIGSGEQTVFYGTLLFFSGLPIFAWLYFCNSAKR